MLLWDRNAVGELLVSVASVQKPLAVLRGRTSHRRAVQNQIALPTSDLYFAGMAKRLRNLYCYGKETFSSKVKAARFFSELRAQYGLGDTITDAEHVAAVRDLFQGHCDREKKIGCGVKRFFVNSAPFPLQHTTCFWIERLDGKNTDFGFPACIEGIAKLNCDSLRRVIRSQVESYKQAKLAENGGQHFVSEFSGETFAASKAHVDHVTPFATIVAQFAAQEGIEIKSELLTVACDAKSEPTWKEPALARRFAEFHADFPLRIVSAHENLSTLRRTA